MTRALRLTTLCCLALGAACAASDERRASRSPDVASVDAEPEHDAEPEPEPEHDAEPEPEPEPDADPADVDAVAPTGPHPRLFLGAERLAALADKRATDWFAWRLMLSRIAEDSTYEPHTPELAAANALAYRVTGDPAYLARAKQKVESFYATWDYADPSGLTFQWYGRYLPWCFDWLYDDLDAEERARWARWIEAANAAWLERIDYAHGGATRPTDGIRTEDTDHTLMIMENFLYAGVALAGDDEAFSTSMLAASDAIWDGVVLARYIPDAFAGGFDPVGPMYAGYQACHMARADVVRGETRGLPRERAFFDRYLEAMIHEDFPGFAGQLEHGDMHVGNYQPDGWSTEQWPPYSSVDALATLAGLTADAGLRDHALYNLGRYRAAHAEGPLFNAYHSAIDLVLFAPPGAGSDPALGHRATSFRAAHFAAARSDWGDDASALYVQAAPWNMDHTHRDAGHFTVVRHGRAVTSDVAGYPGSGAPSCDSTLAHDTLLLENSHGGEQTGVDREARTGDVVIDRFDPGAGFTYVATDLAAAYEYVGWNGVDSSGDDYLEHALRKVVWLHPDLVIVYDHVAQNAGVGPRRKRSLMHLHGAPAQDGGRIVGEADGNAYAFESILPTSATVTLTTDAALLTAAPPDFMEGQKHALVIVDAGSGSGPETFLAALALGDAGPPPVAGPDAVVTPFVVVGGQGVQWSFRGARGVVVMKEGPGTFSTVSYAVPAGVALRHIVTDLPPATEVGVSAAVVAGELHVSIGPDGAARRVTTAAGSLELGTDLSGALGP